MAIKHLTKEEYQKMFPGKPIPQSGSIVSDTQPSSAMGNPMGVGVSGSNIGQSHERSFLGNILNGILTSATKLPARINTEIQASAPGYDKTQAVPQPGIFGGGSVMPFQAGHTWENLKKLTGETLETGLALVPGLGEVGAVAKGAEVAGELSLAAKGANIVEKVLPKGSGLAKGFGLTRGALEGKDVVEGANFIRNAYKVAKTGAQYGAGYGLATGLEEDHTVLQTLGDMLTQAAAGAIIAPVIHTGLKGIGAGVRSLEKLPETGTGSIKSMAKGTNKSIEQHLNPYSHLSPEEASIMTPEEAVKIKQESLDEANLMKDAQLAWNEDQTATHTPFTLAEDAKTRATNLLKDKIKTVGKEGENFVDNSPQGQIKTDLSDFNSTVGTKIKSITASEISPGGAGLGAAEAGSKISEAHSGVIEGLLQDVNGLGEKPSVQEIDHLLKKWADESVSEKTFDKGYPTTRSEAFINIKRYLIAKADKVTNGKYSEFRGQYHDLSNLEGFLKSSVQDVSTMFDAVEQGGKEAELARLFDEVRQETGINLISTAKMAKDAFQAFNLDSFKSFRQIFLGAAESHPPIGLAGKLRMGANVFKRLLKTNKDAFKNTLKIIQESTPEGATRLNDKISSTREDIAKRVAQLSKFKTITPEVDRATGAIKEFVKIKTGKDVPIENVRTMIQESAPQIKEGGEVSKTPIGQALLEAVDFSSQKETQSGTAFQGLIDKIKGSYETYKAAAKQGIVAQLLEADGVPKEIINANKLRIETALSGGGKNGQTAFMKEIEALKSQLQSFKPSTVAPTVPEAPVAPPVEPTSPETPPVETPPTLTQ